MDGNESLIIMDSRKGSKDGRDLRRIAKHLRGSVGGFAQRRRCLAMELVGLWLVDGPPINQVGTCSLILSLNRLLVRPK